MTDWTSGYVADIGYTFGYYKESNPQHLRLAFLNAGLTFPEIGTACELGFGQGVSANCHAAGSVSQWFGTDFNPAQADFAQELATHSGAAVQLFDNSFAEFNAREDLPDFDYICLHGIWSWISDENRTEIVDFVRRKLKVGGVLYISYNTQPGWATMLPMRELFVEHAQIMGATGHGMVNRVNTALAFAEQLFSTNPAYLRANPQLAERLKTITGQDRHYLAHEYFNRDWQPMSFAKMAVWLASAKLNFACSAHYQDHIEQLHLSTEQQKLLHDIPDPLFKETVRDFCVNQQFRRDYWVKGARTLNHVEQAAALRAHRLLLIQHRADVSLTINCNPGQVAMQEPIYTPILDALANHKPQTIGQLEQAIKSHGITFPQLLQAVVILTDTGALAAVQSDAVIEQAKTQTDKLNHHLCTKARDMRELNYLASPVTGGGIMLTRFPQLFLLALTEGNTQPQEWAKFVWDILSAQGQRIVKEGEKLSTEAENIAELNRQAIIFDEQQLPILRALAIA
jgi:SAM-dependent methyltransferase